ncbi:TPA: hypothetical protein N0F65_005564 [Lagenidium giganteum]|uniref:Integrase catalytic domain-containing protein n=1 Tax=Lagenidium giganteum TaxID=4803 RepID=A0AAV2Z9Y8_9STRA|nr:TPA: hypothetical protein N0F65_005564 [Lagenidium giganteum]
MQAARVGKWYVMGAETALRAEPLLASTVVASDCEAGDDAAELWQCRLGHVPVDHLANIDKAYHGLPHQIALTASKTTLCEGCARGQIAVSRFPSPTRGAVKTTRPMHGTDLHDDFSRHVTLYFLKSKAGMFERFEAFKAMMETQLGMHIKCVRSDNGKEHVDQRFAHFCSRQGIIHQTTVPYSPQQNGVTERMNRTIAEMARSIIHHRGMETH